MKVDALLIVAVLIFIFVAWIVTGGPTRPIAHQGPFITPVTTEGQQSQGYRGNTPPPNTTNPNAYPTQIRSAQ